MDGVEPLANLRGVVEFRPRVTAEPWFPAPRLFNGVLKSSLNASSSESSDSYLTLVVERPVPSLRFAGDLREVTRVFSGFFALLGEQNSGACWRQESSVASP